MEHRSTCTICHLKQTEICQECQKGRSSFDLIVGIRADNFYNIQIQERLISQALKKNHNNFLASSRVSLEQSSVISG
jgi:hypothetical protein